MKYISPSPKHALLWLPFKGRGMRAESCQTHCDPMDCSSPGSSVHEVFQARILEWVAISTSRRSSPPRDGTCVYCVSCVGRWVLYHWATWEAPSKVWKETKVSFSGETWQTSARHPMATSAVISHVDSIYSWHGALPLQSFPQKHLTPL